MIDAALRQQLRERLCAVVESDGDASAPTASRRTLATALRWDAESVLLPRHVLRSRPRGSLALLCPALAPEACLYPISSLEVEWGAELRLAVLKLPVADGGAPSAPPSCLLASGAECVVAGFALGASIPSCRRGRILATAADTPGFEGLLRGEQRIDSGMSGSAVLAAREGGWSLAGIVLGESAAEGAEPPGEGNLRGARILPFFARSPGGGAGCASSIG